MSVWLTELWATLIGFLKEFLLLFIVGLRQFLQQFFSFFLIKLQFTLYLVALESTCVVSLCNVSFIYWHKWRMKRSTVQKCVKLSSRFQLSREAWEVSSSRIGNPEPFRRGARLSRWSSSTSQWILVRRRVHGSMDTYFGGRRRDCESYSYLWHSENNDPEHWTGTNYKKFAFLVWSEIKRIILTAYEKFYNIIKISCLLIVSRMTERRAKVGENLLSVVLLS